MTANTTTITQPIPPAINQNIPICGGKALVYFTSKEVGGPRVRGWLCRPNGTRVERILLADVDEAEQRAQALILKGKL
ncbi:hypothetical protein [Mesorhizobium sp.]|uniref:hypothetical protein n=1 Tax=Mesorhizobium sp. TaxID=1871066 RepID=UPI000FE4FE15|nr:hypothetical protein [Mesorhizobium sp.]RWI80815.1 MAG: hypothetical protein EOR19_01990 [Mesorhizobium sp.]